MTSRRRILVTGGTGLLATELKSLVMYDFWIFKSHANLDITNPAQINHVINELKPDIIFHAAALTKPMVLHEENPALSIKINIIGTSNIALACIEHNIKMVYISTDWVYAGTGSSGMYSETEATGPTTNYGKSKLGGECATRMVPNHLILRTSMMPKPFPHKAAFVDCTKSCIYVEDAAKLMKQAVENDLKGIYNLGGAASSLYDFVQKDLPDIEGIFRNSIKDISIPQNTSMNCTKLKRALQWKK